MQFLRFVAKTALSDYEVALGKGIQLRLLLEVSSCVKLGTERPYGVGTDSHKIGH